MINEFKKKIAKNLDDRFSKYLKKNNMMVATFLDPNFKQHEFDDVQIHAVLYATKIAALKEAPDIATDFPNAEEEEDEKTESNDKVILEIIIPILGLILLIWEKV